MKKMKTPGTMPMDWAVLWAATPPHLTCGFVSRPRMVWEVIWSVTLNKTLAAWFHQLTHLWRSSSSVFSYLWCFPLPKSRRTKQLMLVPNVLQTEEMWTVVSWCQMCASVSCFSGPHMVTDSLFVQGSQHSFQRLMSLETHDNDKNPEALAAGSLCVKLILCLSGLPGNNLNLGSRSRMLIGTWK